MATAVSLVEAAEQSWDNLEALSIAGTLRTRILAFCTAIVGQFPQEPVVGHPVANWIAVLQAFAINMSSTASNWTVLRLAAEYVYRLCFMASALTTQLPTQTTAVLTAYNAQF